MVLPANSSVLMTLGTLVLTVFMAGSFFGGDFRYRQELKAEIKEVKTEHAAVMQQVKEANLKYQSQQLEFNRQTLEFYKTLEGLAGQKQEVVKKLKDQEKKVVEQTKKLELEVTELGKILESDKIEFEKNN